MSYQLRWRERVIGDVTLSSATDAAVRLQGPQDELIQIVQQYHHTLANWGFLGSVDDEGDRRGRAALLAYEDMLAELRLIADDSTTGPRVRMVHVDSLGAVRLDVEIDDLP